MCSVGLIHLDIEDIVLYSHKKYKDLCVLGLECVVLGPAVINKNEVLD
jgi:hypothetical protein